jgi:F-type H+-transporting ATPase subunit b
MPQLDFSNVLTISQVVWMALIFGALYLLLSRWALPQVSDVLADRAARISADLDTARLAKAEADAAVAELLAATRKASTEAQSAISASISKAKAEAAEQARIANERLDAQLAEAELRIAAARHAAMGALRDVAIDTAGTVVARLTGKNADASLLGRAVDQALPARGA